MKRSLFIFQSLSSLVLAAIGLWFGGVARADCITAPSGLVGWWKGDGNSLDSIGTNNGVNQNITFSNGVVGQAFACDPENYAYGTYTGIQIADRPAYVLTNSLTIEGWVRPRGDGYILFFRGDHRPGLDPYFLSMNGNSNLDFYITDPDGNYVHVETTLPYFEWTHVAATLDGSSGAMSIYTNGVLAVQTVTTSRPFGDLLPDQSPGVGIGNLNDGGNNFPFLGDIDEIGLYNRALALDEIRAIYNAGSAGKCLAAPEPVCSLLNVDFGSGGARGYSLKTGFAAIGQTTNDFWNFYDRDASSTPYDWRNSGTLANLQTAIGETTTVGMSVSDAPGAWNDASSDPMYMTYDYPLDGGNNVVTFTNLPPGQYDVLVYSPDGNFEITAGGTSYGIKTSYDSPVSTVPAWTEGVQYARFRNVALAAGQPLVLTVRNGVGGWAILSGVQILKNATAIVPAISGFAPATATNGASLTLSGTNFNASAASNIVYFGAVRAIVSSASPTNLTVIVPAGATFAPITVTVKGLTTYSPQPFLPTFTGTGTGISTASFGTRQNLDSGKGPIQVVIADLDNDGKPDLIVANDYNNTISLYRNLGSSPILTAASFAPPVDLTTPAGSYSPYGIVAADVDGDGKLDIIATDFSGPNVVSVYRNTCSPGEITAGAFATRVDFPTGSQPQGVAVGDIDGDGRPDLLVANTGDGTVSILRNTSIVGSLTADSFAPKVDFTTGGGCANVTVGDLDGDGIPDVATANSSGSVSLLRNLSSPGNLAFAPKVNFATLDGALHVKLVDLDGDGKLDVTVECYLPQTMSVFRNTSTAGSLTADSLAPRIDYALGGRGHTTAVGDLDGDGKPDLAVATELDSLISIFQNTGTPGIFTNSSLAGRVDLSTGWNAWGVAVGDLDGDGRPDVVFANSYDNNISIYQNQSPIAGPPIITQQPTSRSVAEGSTTLLSVAADGVQPFGYQWKFNGANLTGATNATLTLTNLHPNQTGNYAVTISSPYGSTTSSNAVVTVIAQTILIYKYSGIEKITSAGQTVSNTYSGEFLFIPDTTNGTFVGWSNIKGKKSYWVNPLDGYLLFSIAGSGGNKFTVLGQAGQEVDSHGQFHLWSDLHKGQNTQLTIGKKKFFSFPGLFADNATRIHPDPQTGQMILDEAVSTYTFLSKDTQAANANGQTVADLVNALTSSLAKQGYQSQ